MAISGLQGRSIAVFCSAREVAPEYFTLARSTGESLAESGVTLIHGAGLANAISTETIITKSMHDRKEWMEDHSDAFIVLPGGLGTLDELVTVMTTKQLKQHMKPIVLLDPTDYYLPLTHLFAHMI